MHTYVWCASVNVTIIYMLSDAIVMSDSIRQYFIVEDTMLHNNCDMRRTKVNDNYLHIYYMTI